MAATEIVERVIDPRIKLLSHSSRTTLHTCPRKFQLYRLQAQRDDDGEGRKSVTFAYGHALGVGIQCVMQGLDSESVLFNMFLAWDMPLLAEEPKKHKSFAECVHAVNQFIAMRAAGLLANYELYWHDGVPAVEFSFRIRFADGFAYRGHIDLVLVQKETKRVAVLEVKHVGNKWVHEASYKNSGQAIGYSIVLDYLFPGLSEYEVHYLPYLTERRAFEPMVFKKTLLMRALWLQELLLDVRAIETFEEVGVYPMHGESCMAFMRPCEYFGSCTMSTKNLTTELPADFDAASLDSHTYIVDVSIYDLIKAQLQREGI